MRYSFLFLLLLVTSFSMAQWKTTTPYGVTINDIQFTDRYTGYAVFQAQGTGSCMTTNSMYKTIDEGKSWIKMNTGTTNAINAVYFVNSMTGWFAGASSEIRKTTDGGAPWIQVSTGVGSGMNDIWFKDLNNGFVIGNNGLLRKSTNGGSTWQTIASGVTTTLRKIFFYDTNLGFIICGNGQILRTTNGGTNWSVITTGAVVLNDIFFTTSQTGYAVGAYSLYTTQNGGLSWTLSSLTSAVPLTRMYFPSPEVGYIVADGEGILRTTDSATTWTLTTTQNGQSDSWRGIYFTDNYTGYICGSLGRIDKTTDGGNHWINMISGFGQELNSVTVPHKDTAFIGSKYGKIFKTDNGGISYFQQSSPVLSTILRVRFLNPEVGFACSDSGRILRTTDGGTHWNLIPTHSFRTITDMHFISFDEGFAAASGGIVFKTTNNGLSWDSIQTGFNEDYRGIWFTNADTGYVISNQKIVHTFDGGLTWTSYTAQYANYLTDIVFTNPLLGYCAGGFGKFLYTPDAGVTWDTCNAGTGNAEINEMWALNDSTIYFARYGSQAMTIDSCQHLSTLSTACLANNWSQNSIAMTPDATWGYSVGGLTGVVHQLEIPEIIKTFTSVNAYCAGSPLFIGFFARGFYGTGNIFTAELSDATGSFASPQVIGTYTTQHMIYQSGIITAMIPAGLTPGNYRVRVNASNPAIIGPDNGYDIVIQPVTIPALSLQASVAGACTGQEIIFDVFPTAGGMNPVFTWLLNGDTLATTASHIVIDSLANGDTLQVFLQSDLACANPDTASSNLYIASLSSPPVFSLGFDTAVCAHTVIQLNGPAGFAYSWTPATGLSNPSIANPQATISSSISYQLSISDSNNCSYSDTVFIMAFPLPEVPVITLVGDTLTAPPAAAYQWYLDSIEIPGATDSIHIPLISGNYTVLVINGFGCSRLSEPFIVILEGLQQIMNQSFIVYPNPVGDQLSISGLIPFSGILEIRIHDITGKQLMQETRQIPGETTFLRIPVAHLSKGIYFCRFNNRTTSGIVRFIK
jgi:photosystem II stability/assembly factor-like uncharacterized protein